MILHRYICSAMKQAVYEKIDENEYAGKIPSCWGVIVFGQTLEECKRELLSVLEDWILLGLVFGHHIPIICGIDINNTNIDKRR